MCRIRSSDFNTITAGFTNEDEAWLRGHPSRDLVSSFRNWSHIYVTRSVRFWESDAVLKGNAVLREVWYDPMSPNEILPPRCKRKMEPED